MKNELDFPEQVAEDWFNFYGKRPNEKGYTWDMDSKEWVDFCEKNKHLFNEMSDLEMEDTHDLVRGHKKKPGN